MRGENRVFRGRRSDMARFKVFMTLSLLFFVTSISLVCSQVVYGEQLPDFTLTDIDGNTFSLSDFRGKVVVLDFFARYCPPCRTEMSHLKAVQDEFGSRLVIVSISVWIDDTDENLRQFRDEFDITWIVARDTEGLRQKYDVTELPVLFIIDHEGYEQHRHVGLTDKSILQEEISEIITAIDDVNGDGLVDIFDVVLVSLAFDSRRGDPNWNQAADLNIDDIVDIFDIVILANNIGS